MAVNLTFTGRLVGKARKGTVRGMLTDVSLSDTPQAATWYDEFNNGVNLQTTDRLQIHTLTASTDQTQDRLLISTTTTAGITEFALGIKNDSTTFLDLSAAPLLLPFGANITVSEGALVWTPTQLGSDLALWLDAEDTASITLNGSTVSQWNDKSGNDRHATQDTAANQPTYKATDAVLGGKPSVGAPSAAGTVGVVAPSLTAQTLFFVMAYGTGVETVFPGFSAYPTVFSGPNANGQQRGGMGTTATDDWFSSGMWAAYPFVNAATTTSTVALPMPASILRFEGPSAVTQSWGIGHNMISANRSWAGPIGEVVALTGVLSDEDRQKLEGYLAWKWGGI